MRIVGLRIESGNVAASVVEKGMRQSELRDAFSRSFASDAELADILREQARGWGGARIVTSIPGRQFSQRTVTLPFGDRKRVEKALPFELEDAVPFSLDDVELDHISFDHDKTGKSGKKETSVVAVMIPKAALRRHLELLATAGVDPQVVLPSYIGLARVSAMIPVEGPAVVIDGNDLCLMDGGVVRACRSFSAAGASGGLGHTMKALETDYNVRIEKAVALSDTGRAETELAELGIGLERLRPDFHGKTPDDAVSLGLALTGDVNFRKGEFAYRLEDAGRRKRRRTLLITAIFAAVVAAANMGVKYYLLEASYGKLDREIKDIYRKTFPDSRAVPDPVRQLRTKLDEARKKFGVLGSGSSALDAMKAVTEGIPNEVRVSFNDFNLDGGRLNIQGEAESFESVDKMKAELQKTGVFSEVQVQDTRMGVNNKVKFRFEIKLKQGM